MKTQGVKAWRPAALEAGGIGAFEWDLSTDRGLWDERLELLFGYAHEDILRPDEAISRVHSEDRAALAAAVAAAVAVCGEFRVECRLQLPDGRLRWVAGRGRALAGSEGQAVRLLGIAYDTTELRTGQAWATRLVETTATGFGLLDADGRLTYLNPAAADLLGLDREDMVGKLLVETFPGLAETS